MKRIFKYILKDLKTKFEHGKQTDRREQGQILVIVTLSVIALVAVVGLTVDVGLLYVNHGKLRRAVDAAALAASSQAREKYGIDEISAAATEFLALNGISDPSAIVETCKSTGGTDPELCTDPPRNLVRVRATSVMPLAFLPVIGIHSTTISASAISEAASIDVVLAIDVSDSMTWDVDPTDPMYDPSQCNPGHNCHPFEEVRDAAQVFVSKLDLEYDRVSIVTFDDGARIDLPLTNDPVAIDDAIRDLKVFDPGDCSLYSGSGTCRLYVRYDDCQGGVAWAHGNCDGDPGNEAYIDENGDGIGDFYAGLDCPIYHSTGNPDTCGTTNIGGGFQEAGNALAAPATLRKEALWVVILLTDGAANAPSITCPNTTWATQPFCRDHDPFTRHCFELNDVTCQADNGVYDPDHFDTDDFARDMADFVAEDQKALIFTIGLGQLVRTSPPRILLDSNGNPTDTKCVQGDPADSCLGAGESLLKYAADIGKGAYYYSPSGNMLSNIFLDIASNLATRLTQ